MFIIGDVFCFRCMQWVQNTRVEGLRSIPPEKLCNGSNRLCAKHFEVSQFMNPSLRNKLVWNAVPTLFDVPNPPKQVTPKRPQPKKRTLPPPTGPAIKRQKGKSKPNHEFMHCCSHNFHNICKVLNLVKIYTK